MPEQMSNLLLHELSDRNSRDPNMLEALTQVVPVCAEATSSSPVRVDLLVPSCNLLLREISQGCIHMV